jgi:hypothetical protein
MEAFEPWLQILENDLDEDVLTSLASLIPPIWYDFDSVALRVLLTALNERRKSARSAQALLQHQSPCLSELDGTGRWALLRCLPLALTHSLQILGSA